MNIRTCSWKIETTISDSTIVDETSVYPARVQSQSGMTILNSRENSHITTFMNLFYRPEPLQFSFITTAELSNSIEFNIYKHFFMEI